MQRISRYFLIATDDRVYRQCFLTQQHIDKLNECCVCVYMCSARAVHTLPAMPRSTQPSTLHGTVNEYQLSG